MDRRTVTAVAIVAVMVSAVIIVSGVYITRHGGPPWKGWPNNRITIGGDDEFESSAALVSGAGTESDPYVLSVSVIDFSSGVGMDISNTSAHFVLRDSSIRFHDPYADCFLMTGFGIRIANSSNFAVSEVSLQNCYLGVSNCSRFEISGFSLSYETATFDNCTDGRVEGISTGELTFTRCTGIIVNENLNTTIVLRDCRSSDVHDNVINRSGITMSGCSSCRVFSNAVSHIQVDGWSSDVQISDNHLRNGSNNGYGAIFLDNVVNITVEGNDIRDAEWAPGIHLWHNVSNCMIVRNDISGCHGGICLRGASGCVVYHNNIMSSLWSGGYDISGETGSDPVYYPENGGGVLDEQGWLNAWDAGYPGGGNYYFDYSGADMYSGPGQDVLGADGLGDTPLVIYTYLSGDPGVDHYPLAAPFPV